MATLTKALPSLLILGRIRAILLAIFFAATGHGAMFVLLPVVMTKNGASIYTLGLVMACYSLGVLVFSRYSQLLIRRTGHHRIYSAMAAMVCVIAILHMMFGNTIIMALLRFGVGACMAIMYVTLESWLSTISDRNSRGFIYAFYQVSFGLGFMLAPFVANVFPSTDPRSFALVAMCMALSLLPLLFSLQSSPVIEGDQPTLPIIELLRDSPISSVGAIVAGLLTGLLLTLISVYFLNLGYEGQLMALLVATPLIGSLLFQMPVGKLADRINKRLLMVSLCILASISAVVLVLCTWLTTSAWWLYVPPLLTMGGSIMCLYPLAVTLLFEQVESDKAVPAMGSMLTLHTYGLLLGPIVGSVLMGQFGNSAMPMLVPVFALGFGLFVLYRKRHSIRHVDRESIPYVLCLQSLRSYAANLDPRLDNLVFVRNNPGLRALANSIALVPKRALRLMKANRQLLDVHPATALESLVLLKPRLSRELVSAMVKLYPDRRMELLDGLGDIIVLKKKLINHLLLDGLCQGAEEPIREQLRERFAAILDDHLHQAE